MTSVTAEPFATLVAAVNSQARMLFDGGRSGLLPAWLGHLRQPSDAPPTMGAAMAGSMNS